MDIFMLVLMALATVLLWTGLYLGFKKLKVPAREVKISMTITILTAGLWYPAAIVMARQGFFAARPDRLPMIPIVLLVTAVLGWYLLRKTRINLVFDAFPGWIIAFQFFRIMGFNFVLLLGENKLPAVFAIPIGWGDVIIGLAAPVVGYLYARQAFGAQTLAAFWNLAGIGVIIWSGSVVMLGQTSLVQLLHLEPGVDSVTHFPIAMEAVYGMPLVIFLHTYSLWTVLFSKPGTTFPGLSR